MDVKKVDVTDKVTFGWNDDESLPLTKCVCGAEFDLWDVIIGIDDGGDYRECPNCNRKLFWTTRIKVFEVQDV